MMDQGQNSSAGRAETDCLDVVWSLQNADEFEMSQACYFSKDDYNQLIFECVNPQMRINA